MSGDILEEHRKKLLESRPRDKGRVLEGVTNAWQTVVKKKVYHPCDRCAHPYLIVMKNLLNTYRRNVNKPMRKTNKKKDENTRENQDRKRKH